MFSIVRIETRPAGPGKVDHAGRAAAGGGDRPALEVVGGAHRPDGQVEVGVRIDSSGDDQRPRRIEHSGLRCVQSLAGQIVGQTDPRGEIVVARVPHSLRRTHASVADAIHKGDRGAAQAVEVEELCESVVLFVRCAVTLPAQPQIQRQSWTELEVVLHEQVVVVHDVVSIRVSPLTGMRIDR